MTRWRDVLTLAAMAAVLWLAGYGQSRAQVWRTPAPGFCYPYARMIVCSDGSLYYWQPGWQLYVRGAQSWAMPALPWYPAWRYQPEFWPPRFEPWE